MASGTGRVVTITALGNTKDLEAAFQRAGTVVSDASTKMADSAKRAGQIAADAAKQMGASADEQAAAAGKAAEAYQAYADSLTRSQKVAGAAAAKAAESAGASADEQTAAYGRAALAAKASADEQEASSVRTGAAMDGVGAKSDGMVSKLSGIGKWAAVGFVGAAAGAIKLGDEFESAGAKIQGTTGISKSAAAAITHAFAGTAGEFQTSGEKMEGSFAEVSGQLKLTEGHALNAGESLKFMSEAERLSEATGTKLGASTGALSGIMQAYHLQVSQTARASDVLFNASKSLAVPPEQVATAMAKLHSKLGELAPTLGDVSALMVALGSHGVQGSRGLQVVNTAFQTLVGHSEKTTEVLKDLGVNIFNQSGQFVGMRSVIAQLQPKLDSLTQSQRVYAEQALFGKGAAQVMGQVVLGGVPGFEKATHAATEMGTAQKAAKIQQETLSGTAHTLLAAIETLGGSIGLALLPPLKVMASELSSAFKFMTENKGVAEALGAAIATVLGVAVAVFAEQQAVKFIGGVQSMITDLKAFGSAVVATTGKVIGSFQTQTTEVGAAEGEMVAETKTAAISIDGALMATGIGAALVALGYTAVKLKEHWKESMRGMELAAQAAANFIVGVLNKVISVIETLTLGLVKLGKIKKTTFAEEGENKGGYAPPGAMKPGSMTAEGSNAASQVVNALVKHAGISKQAAQGVASVLYSESGLRPTALEGNSRLPANEAGYGIAQWTQGRRKGLERFAGQGHESGNSVKTQTEYLIAELEGSQSPTLAALKGAKTSQQAIEAFVSKFEVPENIPHVVGVAEGNLGTIVGQTRGAGTSKAAASTGTKSNSLSHLIWETEHAKEAKNLESEEKSKKSSVASETKTKEREVRESREKVEREHKTSREKSERGTLSELEKVYGTELGGAATKGAGKVGGAAVTEANKTTTELKAAGKALTTELAKAMKEVAATAEKIKKQDEGYEKTGGSKLEKYESGIQSGSITSLRKMLGASTAHPGGEGSAAEGNYNKLIATLKGTHEKALEKLATKLVDAHREALATLNSELVSEDVKSVGRKETREATMARDQNKLAEDMSNRIVEGWKEANNLIVDAFNEVATRLKDQGQMLTDAYTGAVTGIKDATAEMQQVASAAVKAIQDNSQAEVDKMAERGLYGLNLVAQQQQVQLDEMKKGYDTQISLAEAASAHAQTEGDTASNATQLMVDAVTAQQDALLGVAKAHIGIVEQNMNGALQATEKNLDEVTKRTDQAVGVAEDEVATAANSSKATQDAAAAHLEKVKGEQSKQVAEAEGSLTSAKNASAQAVQQAQQALSTAEANAQTAEQQAQNAVTSAHGKAEVVVAEAQRILAEAQDKANVAEAEEQALVEKTKEEAATQYTGSGLQVNIMGIENTNAAAIAAEVGWQLRTQIAA